MFMSVTTHWTYDLWNIQKWVIAFRVFNEAHIADNIYRFIHGIIKVYGLMFKIFSISFDNASINKNSIRPLEEYLRASFGGKYFHIRWACHVFNLCVQTILESIKKKICRPNKRCGSVSGKEDDPHEAMGSLL